MSARLKIALCTIGFLAILIAAALILKEEFNLVYLSKKTAFKNTIEQYQYKEKMQDVSYSSDYKFSCTDENFNKEMNSKYFGLMKIKLLSIDKKSNQIRLEITNNTRCIYSDFTLVIDFLDFCGYVIETKTISVDGVNANQMRFITLELPEKAQYFVISKINYNYYTKDEVLFTSYPNALEIEQPLNNNLCRVSLTIKGDSLLVKFKRKAKFTKAVLMLHNAEGNIMNAFELADSNYSVVLPYSDTYKYYSINLIR